MQKKRFKIKKTQLFKRVSYDRNNLPDLTYEKVKELSLAGEAYEGEWKNGQRHGQGTMTYANGAVYEGE